MASAINPSNPVSGSPTTQSVRDNFAAAKTEIEALQASGGGGGGGAAGATVSVTAPAGPVKGQLWINENTGALKYWDGAWTTPTL